jgi:regulator of sirC expression with transglutaminase-like and TPR domain
MFRNLLRVAGDDNDAAGSLRYVDAILTLTPDAAEERGVRIGLRYQTGDKAGALKDIDWLLENKPDGVDLDRVREFRKRLEK